MAQAEGCAAPNFLRGSANAEEVFDFCRLAVDVPGEDGESRRCFCRRSARKVEEGPFRSWTQSGTSRSAPFVVLVVALRIVGSLQLQLHLVGAGWA